MKNSLLTVVAGLAACCLASSELPLAAGFSRLAPFGHLEGLPFDLSNFTVELDAFGGFGTSRLQTRQGCRDSGYSPCANYNFCCPTGDNCQPGGCCSAGQSQCGASHCYNPSTSVCCGDQGSCSIGYDCVSSGCCPSGTIPCGTGNKCYNAATQQCCGSGSTAYVCGAGSACCGSSSCYNTATEQCCAGGSCLKSQTCCGSQCCNSVATCGSNGICSAKTTSTSSRPTSTFAVITPTISTTPTTSSSPSTTPTSSISIFSGGKILTGSCATPEFTLIRDQAAQVTLAPVIGCVGGKPDCCPFDVAGGNGDGRVNVTPTQTGTGPFTLSTTSTVVVAPSGTSGNNPPEAVAFPAAAYDQQSTLNLCPADYATLSGSCCPTGYSIYSAKLGGVTPCFSSVGKDLSSPTSIASTSATSDTRPTVTVLNLVYALAYPVKSSSGGLSTGATVGISVGSAAAGIIAIGGLGFLLVRRKKKNKESRHTSTTPLAAPMAGVAQTHASTTSPSYGSQPMSAHHSQSWQASGTHLAQTTPLSQQPTSSFGGPSPYGSPNSYPQNGYDHNQAAYGGHNSQYQAYQSPTAHSPMGQQYPQNPMPAHTSPVAQQYPHQLDTNPQSYPQQPGSWPPQQQSPMSGPYDNRFSR